MEEFKEIFVVKEIAEEDGRDVSQDTFFEDRDDAYKYVSERMNFWIKNYGFEIEPFTYGGYERKNDFPVIIHKKDDNYPESRRTWKVNVGFLYLHEYDKAVSD